MSLDRERFIEPNADVGRDTEPLRLKLLQTTPDGRYRIKVSINRPNESDYLPLLQVEAAPGDPFFVAGQAFDGGTLIVGVRLSPGN